MLGRAADPSAADWRDVPTQTAVGLAQLRRAADETQHALGVPASAEGSLWDVVTAFAGFSAGAGGVASAWIRWAPELRALPDGQRFARILQRVAERVAAGEHFLPVLHHPNAAYTALRTAQKLAVGKRLRAALLMAAGGATAADLPAALAWWGPAVDSSTEALVSLGAAGRIP
jgi:hypothetical protein